MRIKDIRKTLLNSYDDARVILVYLLYRITGLSQLTDGISPHFFLTSFALNNALRRASTQRNKHSQRNEPLEIESFQRRIVLAIAVMMPVLTKAQVAQSMSERSH
jgi:hypothetical protein